MNVRDRFCIERNRNPGAIHVRNIRISAVCGSTDSRIDRSRTDIVLRNDVPGDRIVQYSADPIGRHESGVWIVKQYDHRVRTIVFDLGGKLRSDRSDAEALLECHDRKFPGVDLRIRHCHQCSEFIIVFQRHIRRVSHGSHLHGSRRSFPGQRPDAGAFETILRRRQQQ